MSTTPNNTITTASVLATATRYLSTVIASASTALFSSTRAPNGTGTSTSPPDPSPTGNTTAAPNVTTIEPVTQEVANDALYIGVIVAMALAITLFIWILIQLVVRSKLRHISLIQMQQRVRLDAAKYRELPKDPRCRIVEESLEPLKYAIVDPPQYNRILPTIMRNRRDERLEAKRMLEVVRRGLKCTAVSPYRMSMRNAVGYLTGLDYEECERFLSVHDAVLYGVHMHGDGDVNEEDVKFLHQYFRDSILPHLQNEQS